jgi:hypothetical protein
VDPIPTEFTQSQLAPCFGLVGGMGRVGRGLPTPSPGTPSVLMDGVLAASGASGRH